MSSAGPSGRVHESVMGTYVKNAGRQSNDKPVYHQMGQRENILFYSDRGNWVMGQGLNGLAARIISKNIGLLVPPSTGWLYWDGHEWTEDPQLTV